MDHTSEYPPESARPARIRFFGELASLANTAGPDDEVVYPVTRRASLKDVIEALGVPHSEVYRLVVDGREAGFGHRLAPGEAVKVFPGRTPVDVSLPSPLRPEGYPRGRYLVDVNVGKLGTLLRLLGFDAAGAAHLTDAQAANLAVLEKRVLLTRDAAMLRRKNVMHGRLIRASHPENQLRETLEFFGHGPPFATFRRCLRCNVELAPVTKEEVMPRLLPKTRLYFDTFHICPDCRRIYWPGSHHDAMTGWLSELIRDMGRGIDGPSQGRS